MNISQDCALLGEVSASNGFATEIDYREDGNCDELIENGSVDTLLSSAEGGFGPLTRYFHLLTGELGIPERDIYRWANLISDEQEVTLVALQSRIRGSKLKGAVLVPFSTSACYQTLVTPENRGTSYRDFFYNVTYEAIDYANQHWQSRGFATNHLSGCGRPFDVDLALCQCEAVGHQVNDSHAHPIESFCFLGCTCVPPRTFEGFGLRLPSLNGKHRPISKTLLELENGFGHIITLKWPQGNLDANLPVPQA